MKLSMARVLSLLQMIGLNTVLAPSWGEVVVGGGGAPSAVSLLSWLL